LQEQRQLLLLQVLRVLASQALACLQECLHAAGPARMVLGVLLLQELALLTAAAAAALLCSAGQMGRQLQQLLPACCWCR
jgi:hypothetical protein